MRKLLKVVLKEINTEHGTDYQPSDVYFDFERKIITNEQEKAQISLIKAQEEQTRTNTILNVASQFGQELTIQMLCDVMDLDYSDIKDKLPKPDEDSTAAAKEKLSNIQPEG